MIDDAVRRELDALAELAPLHNAAGARARSTRRDACCRRSPACRASSTPRSTRRCPEEAYTYALPRRWREEWAIRRYGFHGLSVAWAAERVTVPRLVVCHLGGGCSVTAVLDGRSVDTTMGFSPLEGVPMATRPGTIDPEILLYLQRHGAATVDELEHALEHESGLVALGGTARVEELEARDDDDARLALAVFCRRVAGAVASAAAALGGLDAVVFTAGNRRRLGTGSRGDLPAAALPRRRAGRAREHASRSRTPTFRPLPLRCGSGSCTRARTSSQRAPRGRCSRRRRDPLGVRPAQLRRLARRPRRGRSARRRRAR